MEATQLLKLIILIGLLAFVYTQKKNIEAIVAIACDTILIIMMVIHSRIACKESQDEDQIKKNKRNKKGNYKTQSLDTSSLQKIKIDRTENEFVPNNLKTSAI